MAPQSQPYRRRARSSDEFTLSEDNSSALEAAAASAQQEPAQPKGFFGFRRKSCQQGPASGQRAGSPAPPNERPKKRMSMRGSILTAALGTAGDRRSEGEESPREEREGSFTHRRGSHTEGGGRRGSATEGGGGFTGRLARRGSTTSSSMTLDGLAKLIESASERHRSDVRVEVERAVDHLGERLNERMEDIERQVGRVETMLRDVRLATNAGPWLGIAQG